MATLKAVRYTGAFTVDNGNLKELLGGSYNDVFSINKLMYATGAGSRAYIEAGAGNDRVTLCKGLVVEKGASSLIDTGTGNDTIDAYYMAVKGSASESIFDGGDGKDYIKVRHDMQAEDLGHNIIRAGAGNGDEVHIHGVMKALSGGVNTITGGDGSTHVHLDKQMNAQSGTNEILLGKDADLVCIDKAILAYKDGENLINTGAGNDKVVVGCELQAYSNGLNEINMGAGDDIACFNTSILASGVNAMNYIHMGEGNDVLNVKYTMGATDYGTNLVNLGDGNDFMHVSTSSSCCAPYALVTATGGVNRILAGAGDDTVFLDGKVTTNGHGTNEVQLGAGHDFIVMNGQVDAGGLRIFGGDGYDTLVLCATNGKGINANYQSWLTSTNGTGSISYENYGGLEAVQVKLSCLSTVKDISPWLKDFADGYEAHYGTGLSLQLNINNNGSCTTLKEIFYKTAIDLFEHVDMTGGCKNTLTISGSFSKQGYDHDELYVTGDNGDRVKLSRDWSDTQTNHEVTVEGMTFTYDVYTNAASGDTLYLEHGLLVYGC